MTLTENSDHDEKCWATSQGFENRICSTGKITLRVLENIFTHF